MYNSNNNRKLILASILQFLGGFTLLASSVALLRYVVDATTFELITRVEMFLTTTGIVVYALYLGHNHEQKEEHKLLEFLVLFGSSPKAFWAELRLIFKKTTKIFWFTYFLLFFIYSFHVNIFVPFSKYFR
jgi:glucose uptake protein GlcU